MVDDEPTPGPTKPATASRDDLARTVHEIESAVSQAATTCYAKTHDLAKLMRTVVDERDAAVARVAKLEDILRRVIADASVTEPKEVGIYLPAYWLDDARAALKAKT